MSCEQRCVGLFEAVCVFGSLGTLLSKHRGQVEGEREGTCFQEGCWPLRCSALCCAGSCHATLEQSTFVTHRHGRVVLRLCVSLWVVGCWFTLLVSAGQLFGTGDCRAPLCRKTLTDNAGVGTVVTLSPGGLPPCQAVCHTCDLQ